MKKWKIMFFFGLISLGLMINRSYAEEDKGVVTLETVVVTGSRAEQSIERVPSNVTVIDEEDIKNSNSQTVVDLLRSEEGIIVRDLLGNGKSAQVDLRGFGETGPYNTLVLVDGRRVNEIDLSGVDWTQISLDQIERIEIVRGSGTVLYGDNAAGGVINIITKAPPKKITLTAGVNLGSFGRNKEQISISGGRERLRASVFANSDTTDGYRANGEYRAKDIGGKIIYDVTESLQFNLSGSHHSDEYGLPGSLTEEKVAVDPTATTTPSDNAESSDDYLKLGFDLDLDNFGRILTDFSYRDRETETQFTSSTFASDSVTETWALTPRYVWDGEIFQHTNTIIAGFDFYWSEQNLDSFYGTPLDPYGVSKVEKASHGVYLNNEFSLLENLILTLGARREQVEYDLKRTDLTGFLAPLEETVTECENAYSAGLIYLYSDRSSIFARANRSLRFPLTDELIVFDYVAGKIKVNSDLRPQKGTNCEIGLKHYVTPDFLGRITFFHAKIDDEIFYNPSTFANENHPETLHQGIEIGGNLDLFKKLILLANYTYQIATFERDPYKDNNIPAVPKHKANFGFRIYNTIPNLIISSDLNYVGSSYAIGDQENQFEKLGRYYTIDVRLSHEWKWLKSYVGVNNLTDQKYSEYAVIGGFPEALNFYPAPERNWVAGFVVVF
jgi:iron complex outermembrane receptor protein